MKISPTKYIVLILLQSLINFSYAQGIPQIQWYTFLAEESSDAVVLASAADNAGNIVIAGLAFDAFQGEGAFSSVAPFNNSLVPNIFIMKLTQEGQYIWHTFLGRSSTVSGDHILDIAIDSKNNIFINGSSHISWDGPFSASPIYKFSGNNLSGFILKINENGEYQWHTFLGSGVATAIFGITIDSADNVYAYGSSSDIWNVENDKNPLNLPDTIPNNFSLSTTSQIFIIKLTNNGTYTWHTFYGPNSSSQQFGLGFGDIKVVKEEDSEFLYIAGRSTLPWIGNDNNIPINPITNSDNLVSDLFLLKLNQDGEYIWHTFQGSGVGRNEIKLAVSELNVYVAGTAFEPWLGNGFISPLRQFQGSFDIFIQSFSKSGEYLWHTYFASIDNDEAYDIEIRDNNILLSGQASSNWKNSINIEPIYPFIEDSRLNGVILSLNELGKLQWYAFLRAAPTTILTASNAIFVAGSGARAQQLKFSQLNLVADSTPPPIHGDEGIFLARFNLDANQPNFSNGVLTLPEVQVGGEIYSASLQLLADHQPITLELKKASLLGSNKNNSNVTFTNNALTIPELFLGLESYAVELSLIRAHSETITI